MEKVTLEMVKEQNKRITQHNQEVAVAEAQNEPLIAETKKMIEYIDGVIEQGDDPYITPHIEDYQEIKTQLLKLINTKPLPVIAIKGTTNKLTPIIVDIFQAKEKKLNESSS